MTDQHPTPRLPGLPRLLALVVLLGGIVGMHVGVFDLGHAWGAAHHASAVAAAPGHSHEGRSHDGVGAGPGSAHSADSDAHATASVTHGAGAALASHQFPAGGSENPVHSAQSIAGPGATRSADDLLAATFAAPLLSVDAVGGHEQDCGDCGVHGGMHACVFILSMLGLAIGLVLLFRLAFEPLDGHGTPGRHRPARRERPPPWTVPTLSELSILRI
ncbi:hypothetical protein [Nocardia cyriacigeorgica]|uniref:Uncharacterized protein n=1 Tax=Nocardia cyriacigeorgica TaxID=135487 RepID=A0A4U8WCR2_9NOCA|nr:hypothetical protein [Nocardia cyriacigeorgica]VFA99598.1 Uncharacterised protein [Nocardia cyriacigeorgica]